MDSLLGLWLEQIYSVEVKNSTQDQLDSVVNISSLKRLDLMGGALTGEQVDRLDQLHQLTDLYLRDVVISNEDLQKLIHQRSLNTVLLDLTHNADLDFTYLGRQVRELRLIVNGKDAQVVIKDHPKLGKLRIFHQVDQLDIRILNCSSLIQVFAKGSADNLTFTGRDTPTLGYIGCQGRKDAKDAHVDVDVSNYSGLTLLCQNIKPRDVRVVDTSPTSPVNNDISLFVTSDQSASVADYLSGLSCDSTIGFEFFNLSFGPEDFDAFNNLDLQSISFYTNNCNAEELKQLLPLTDNIGIEIWDTSLPLQSKIDLLNSELAPIVVNACGQGDIRWRNNIVDFF